MSAIKSWAMIICLVSVICTIIELLFPNGRMSKVFNIILGIFMLCSILIPLKNTFAQINFSSKKTENFINDKDKLKSIVDDQVQMSTRQKLMQNIRKILENKNVNPEKINIIMDTNKEDCISIKKVRIFILKGDENKKDIIKNELKKKLELEIEVVVGSE